MPLTLRKNSDRGTVGLDIDGRFVAAVQLENGRISRAASTELPDGLVKDGEVVEPHALGSALKDFVGSYRLPRTVRLGVANQQIVVRVVELPPMDDAKQLEAAVRFQAAEAIAMPLDEAVLDYQVAGVTESEDGPPRLQVVVVAARRSMIESLLEAAKAAGLKAEGIDLDAFALVRMLAEPGAPDHSARVFCHLAGVANLAVAVGTTCPFTRPLSSTWDAGNYAELADEIRLSIDYYMAQPKARAVSEVVLSGPGSRDPELARGLAEQLGIPTTLAEPLGHFHGETIAPDEDPHRLTVAAGLAMGAAA